MNLKFRRLLSETLERRQLFSADLSYQYNAFDSEPWESDFGTAHFQQFMQVRGIQSGRPANALNGNSSYDAEFDHSRSEHDLSELRSTLRGNRGRMSGESEFSVNSTPPNFNQGGMTAVSQAGKNNSNLGVTSLVQPSTSIRVEITLVSLSHVNRPSAGNSSSNPSPESPAHPSATTITLPATNSSASEFKLVPRGSGNNGDSSDRSPFGYFDSASASQNNQLARTSLQPASADLLGQSTRLSLSGITSKLNQAITSESANRYRHTSTDTALIDITGLADNQLGSKLSASPMRPWKLAEQSINNLKSLSRTNIEAENSVVSNSDLVMANWIESTNGLIDIACRRDPIARVARPADAIEVSARLESKVGLYQVFDVLDDHDHQRISHASEDLVNSKEIVALESIDWGNSIGRDLGPAVKLEADSQSSNESGESSIRKPFFITSVLAVFGGHLLRSRRKQTGLKPK